MSSVNLKEITKITCIYYERESQKETTIFDKKVVVSFCVLIFSLFSLHCSLKIVISGQEKINSPHEKLIWVPNINIYCHKSPLKKHLKKP